MDANHRAMRKHLKAISKVDLDRVIGGCTTGGDVDGGARSHDDGRHHRFGRSGSSFRVNVAAVRQGGGIQVPNGGRRPDPSGVVV